MDPKALLGQHGVPGQENMLIQLMHESCACIRVEICARFGYYCKLECRESVLKKARRAALHCMEANVSYS